MKQKKRAQRTNKRKSQDLGTATQAVAQAGKKIHIRQFVPMDPRPPVCYWEQDEFGTWIGSCDIAWELIEGDLKENHMNYCPRCGGGIQEK